MEAFTYCWTDKTTNKLYVGVHKGSPNDGYICSSKLMKKEYKNRPQDFSRQIIAEGLYVEMLKLETAILKSVNAARDDMFYNQHNSDGNFYCIVGPWKDKKFSEDHKKNISKNSARNAPWKDKQLSEEHKKNISKGGVGKHSIPRTPKWKQKISDTLKGKSPSETSLVRLKGDQRTPKQKEASRLHSQKLRGVTR